MDGITIEVQVRTTLQHVWAEMMERLADRLGRQIRYGLPPTPAGRITQHAAQAVVDITVKISDEWANQTMAEVLAEVPDLEDMLRRPTLARASFSESRSTFTRRLVEGMDRRSSYWMSSKPLPSHARRGPRR